MKIMEAGTTNLVFDDAQHHESVLSSLNMLRREGQFCDVKLVVGGHEITAHRAILATSSRFFLNLFANAPEVQDSYKLRDMDFTSFSCLLDYIYTGRMDIASEDVKQIYRTALQLKLKPVVKACGDYLTSNLNPHNCLGIREFADDRNLKESVNAYIQSNMPEVTTSKYCYSLPRIQVQIIGADTDLLSSTNEKHVFQLVLNWAKGTMSECNATLDPLTDQVNVLYLNSDNALLDCNDINETTLNQDSAVVDYKKKSRKLNKLPETNGAQNGHSVNNTNSNSPPSNAFRKFSLSKDNAAMRECSIVASYQTADRTFMSISILKGQLVTIQVHFRTSPPSPTLSEGPEMTFESASNITAAERRSTLNPLRMMSSPRCAFGVDVLNKKIFACGGYDRGECLKTTEAYDMKDNEWCLLPEMIIPRGRFSGAVVDGKWYGCGGCNGQEELDSVECFDPVTTTWKAVADLPQPKCSAGVGVLNGLLYCVGGMYGQSGVDTCNVYDPKKDEWKRIAPLNEVRSQAGVCDLNGRLYVIGGTDGWHCLNTVEIYDPSTDVWEIGPPLNISRRGAGLVAVEGKLYAIGGSDGVHGLKSVEIFDPVVCKWVFGPEMTIERANVGACVLNNTPYAVGGFSGKHFLETMEYLDLEINEWNTYTPFEEVGFQRDSVKTPQDGLEFNKNGKFKGDLQLSPVKEDKRAEHSNGVEKTI